MYFLGFNNHSTYYLQWCSSMYVFFKITNICIFLSFVSYVSVMELGIKRTKQIEYCLLIASGLRNEFATSSFLIFFLFICFSNCIRSLKLSPISPNLSFLFIKRKTKLSHKSGKSFILIFTGGSLSKYYKLSHWKLQDVFLIWLSITKRDFH